ncbi:unnamed protein product [Darwinula stevensoni]|uniref:Uncharacterized protein n=1 Tax=Darwinula stevensoni TaxID=69355 RepID=A0A7R9A342_9CRUS|nr:unnamed protein product [Darwinula stevensoni]CAG0887027.1 unnamed protein product [Darwinula stevensoni]
MAKLNVCRIVTGIAIVLLSLHRCQSFTPINCRTIGASSGVTVDCDADEMVFHVCGAAGDTSACGGDATEIQCCHVAGHPLSSGECNSISGDPGEMVTCPEPLFLRGACSSFFGETCGGHSHSINCCGFTLSDTLLVPWDHAAADNIDAHNAGQDSLRFWIDFERVSDPIVAINATLKFRKVTADLLV